MPMGWDDVAIAIGLAIAESQAAKVFNNIVDTNGQAVRLQQDSIQSLAPIIKAVLDQSDMEHANDAIEALQQEMHDYNNSHDPASRDDRLSHATDHAYSLTPPLE